MLFSFPKKPSYFKAPAVNFNTQRSIIQDWENQTEEELKAAFKTILSEHSTPVPFIVNSIYGAGFFVKILGSLTKEEQDLFLKQATDFLKEAIRQHNDDLVKVLLSFPRIRDLIDASFLSGLRCDQLDWLLEKNQNISGNAIEKIKAMIVTHHEFLAMEQAKKEIEKSYNIARGDRESALSSEALAKAEKGLERAQELFGKQLEVTGLLEIEKKIKTMILETILEELGENQAVQKKFILDNFEQLIIGDNPVLMSEARAYFSSKKASHVAWRGYDQFAKTHEFDNLLAGKGAHNEIKKRIALYFLALTAKVASKEDIADERCVKHDFLDFNTRKTIFISGIADISRAPGHTQVEGKNNPSCYGGAITRIGEMEGVHSSLISPDPIDIASDIIQGMLSDFISSKMRENDPDMEKEFSKLALAFDVLSGFSLTDILYGQQFYEEPIYEELVNINDLLEHSDAFLKEFIFKNEGIDGIFCLINQALSERTSPEVRILKDSERIYIEKQFHDLSHKSVGKHLAMLIRAKLKPKIAAVKDEDEDLIVLPSIDLSDPFGCIALKKQFEVLKIRIMPEEMRKRVQEVLGKQLVIASEKNERFSRLYSELLTLDIHSDDAAIFVKNIIEILFDAEKKLDLSILQEACESMPVLSEKQKIENMLGTILEKIVSNERKLCLA